MDTQTNNNSAHFCFQDIFTLAEGEMPIKERYVELYRIFNEAVKEQTRLSPLDFSGPFARMDYLCKQAGYAEGDYRRINAFRARCRNAYERSDAELQSSWQDDLKALSLFISAIYQSPVPENLSSILLPVYTSSCKESPLAADYVRIVVDSWDDRFIYGKVSDESSEFVRVAYACQNYFGDWRYIGNLLTDHTQLNLIRPRLKEGVYYAELIIWEPDYLLDISAVAACFEYYGATSLNYLVNKIKPSANSQAILLGNFAGQLLDEVIYHGKNQIPYRESVQRFFRNNALNLAVCPDMQPTFHEQAKKQKSNLERIIHDQFPKVCYLDMDKIVLEPSFLSEMLGLQGRMDLLQEDLRVLMEQKSGKREYLTNKHVEKHYVQMLLYLALIHYNYHRRNEEVSCFLLYSKYADGLMKEGPAPELLFRAIRLRNEIVADEFRYGEGDAGRRLAELTPSALNVNQAGGTLWDKFTAPELARLLHRVHVASPLERAYFDRFFTFLEKEQLLAKLGNAAKEGSGFSSVWNTTLDEKKQTGDIYERLTILDMDGEEDGNAGVSQIRLGVPPSSADFQPNFRVGDIALLYAYPAGREPDARKTMVFRCNIIAIFPEQITVKLRAPQKNRSLFEKPEAYFWAIEHDFVESSFSFLYRALYAFLSATPERKKLLLNQREPEVDSDVELIGDYDGPDKVGGFNELVLKAKQAKDYFLLVGPPGTGKTSFGLVNILKEALLEPNASVLLVSYTNRAVDEICGKLLKHHIDFVRVGSSVSCDEAFRPYLLGQKAGNCNQVGEVRRLIAETRVFVGTTTALSSNVAIFRLKQFSLAIVDEASQILEPHLLALLSAKHDAEDAIRKFVFIGDHKQLPAVVMQNEEESKVEDSRLNAIGLSNCRCSLFERLLSLHGNNPRLVYCMERQGRMHPEVASFPNKAFYQERLRPVPLAHQQQDLSYSSELANPLEKWISSHRLLYWNSPLPSDSHSLKTNLPEARIIALSVYSIWNLYRKSGKRFDSAESVGIIVPYRNQIAMIRKEIASYGVDELLDITVDTVERYQGSERDVMIYGFTVQRHNQLSFLTENVFEEEGCLIDRKLNVALTRAREQMILVGNERLLSQNSTFRKLIEHIRLNGGYSDRSIEEFSNLY